MSEPVSLEALEAKVAAIPPSAFLTTVGDGDTAHVVSAAPRFEAGRLVMGAGRTTRRNAGARPAVTVLWPVTDDERYCLIVDGTAVDGPADEELAVVPTKAILHRLAGVDPSVPNCVPVGAAPSDG